MILPALTDQEYFGPAFVLSTEQWISFPAATDVGQLTLIPGQTGSC
jgi:hypothetical protein